MAFKFRINPRECKNLGGGGGQHFVPPHFQCKILYETLYGNYPWSSSSRGKSAQSTRNYKKTSMLFCFHARKYIKTHVFLYFLHLVPTFTPQYAMDKGLLLPHMPTCLPSHSPGSDSSKASLALMTLSLSSFSRVSFPSKMVNRLAASSGRRSPCEGCGKLIN